MNRRQRIQDTMPNAGLARLTSTPLPLEIKTTNNGAVVNVDSTTDKGLVLKTKITKQQSPGIWLTTTDELRLSSADRRKLAMALVPAIPTHIKSQALAAAQTLPVGELRGAIHDLVDACDNQFEVKD